MMAGYLHERRLEIEQQEQQAREGRFHYQPSLQCSECGDLVQDPGLCENCKARIKEDYGQ
jgi:hypothetical protein